jgi:phosphate transport system substrate-binding protein
MKTRQMLLCAVLLVFAAAPVLGQSLRLEGEGGAATLLSVAKQDYERAKPSAKRLSVAASSTASALGKLCRGEIGIVGAARGIAKAERDACAQNRVEVLEIAVASDAVAVVVNPANSWAKEVSVEELRRAWLETPAKAASWRQLNPAWPDIPLKLYGPGPKMGLGATLRTALVTGSAAPAPELRRDISATDVLSVVIEAVARDRAALGLLDWPSYVASAKRVRLVPVGGALAFPIYLYASTKALEDAETKGYLEHLLANADRLVTQAGLVPLSASTYQDARTRISKKR